MNQLMHRVEELELSLLENHNEPVNASNGRVRSLSLLENHNELVNASSGRVRTQSSRES